MLKIQSLFANFGALRFPFAFTGHRCKFGELSPVSETAQILWSTKFSFVFFLEYNILDVFLVGAG